MKKILLTVFSIVATGFILITNAQVNLDVEGDAVIRDIQPQLTFFDLTDSRTEGMLHSVNDNFRMINGFGDAEFWTGTGGIILPRMVIEGSSGHVGIGQTDPVSFLHLGQGLDVNLTTPGSFTIGDINATNLSFDDNEIQSRNNGLANRLLFQVHGGNVGIGLADPQTKLDVDGVIRATDLNFPRIELFHEAPGETRTFIRGFGDETHIGSPWGDMDFITSDAGSQSISNVRMTIKADDGDIGMGTSNPAVKLNVVGGTDVNAASGGFIQLGNTIDLNLALDDNEIQARDNASASSLNIQRDGGALLLCARELGQVGIGVNQASDLPDSEFLLAVDGKVIAEEIQVEMSQDWPDYVFEDDYNLMPLLEVEASINELGHLPGLPSAFEVENDGLALGNMQKLMMEKIEELTLYVIQLKHEIQALKSND